MPRKRIKLITRKRQVKNDSEIAEFFPITQILGLVDSNSNKLTEFERTYTKGIKMMAPVVLNILASVIDLSFL